jgi:hypothetical protein
MTDVRPCFSRASYPLAVIVFVVGAVALIGRPVVAGRASPPAGSVDRPAGTADALAAEYSALCDGIKRYNAGLELNGWIMSSEHLFAGDEPLLNWAIAFPRRAGGLDYVFGRVLDRTRARTRSFGPPRSSFILGRTMRPAMTRSRVPSPIALRSR